MSAPTTQSAPVFLEGDVSSLTSLDADEARHRISLQHFNHRPNCDVPLYIGVFFDGTNNNRERDEPERSHSNVARLFNAHLAVDAPTDSMRRQGHYRIYVPGVGTRFDAGEEWRESMEGKSMGKGAQARILFAVLEVVNAVHKAFTSDQPLLQPAQVTAKLRDYVRRVEEGIDNIHADNRVERESRKAWMQRLNDELFQALVRARRDRPRPDFPVIRVNVFGFSRGAAQARAFCYWLNDLLSQGALAGLPLQIGFVGLFDCVASVGLSDSVSRSVVGLRFIDGHFGWAKEILGELPAIARRTVHMVAGHEQRLNFPLTRVNGQNVTEIVFPGVHSDVGGGYTLGSQGRGVSEDELLSQIPLALMLRQARREDVPLMEWHYMGKDLRQDFALSPRLVERWNAYMGQADADWQLREGDAAPRFGESTDHAALVRQHRRLYLSWRRHHLHPRTMALLLQQLDVDEQDEEDIASYNRLLAGDLELLRARRTAVASRQYRLAGDGTGDTYPVWVTDELRAGSNYLPQRLTRQGSNRDDADIAWALAQFEGEGVRGQGHFALLSHHVHDSLAGFYLIGYLSNEDKAEKLLAIVRKGRQNGGLGARDLEPYQRSVYDRYEEEKMSDEALRVSIDNRLERESRLGKNATTLQEENFEKEAYRKDSVFSPEESRRCAAVFPKQTDQHASTMADGIENIVRLVTRTRREGGGYLLPRATF
ncbi:MAG: DUF2235 domain-containing protein [Burkholderiales bacterium]|nr:DUF2235 domain-containing protein [Burkholderiales bacterium]